MTVLHMPTDDRRRGELAYSCLRTNVYDGRDYNALVQISIPGTKYRVAAFFGAMTCRRRHR
jgi:hypothetical protein